MKVLIWYHDKNTDDEESKVMSFHAMPRKGEAVRFMDQDWRVSDVIHRCAFSGPINLPAIYLEDGTTGFPK